MPDGTRLNMQTTPVKAPVGQQPAWRNTTGSITPRLDAGNVTPRLDATRDPATVGETFAQTEARKQKESAASGAFGKVPQQASMRQYVQGPPKPTALAQVTPPATQSPAPGAPLQGKALAQNNIATMGIQGAVQDYFNRSKAEAAQVVAKKDAGTKAAWAKSTAMPTPQQRVQPLPPVSTPAWASRPPVTPPATNFAMPPIANPIPIGGTPPQPTAPPAPPVTAAGRAVAPPVQRTYMQPTGGRFAGNVAPQVQEAPQERSKRAKDNYLKTRKTSKLPAWMEGTIAGKALTALSNPVL